MRQQRNCAAARPSTSTRQPKSRSRRLRRRPSPTRSMPPASRSFSQSSPRRLVPIPMRCSSSSRMQSASAASTPSSSAIVSGPARLPAVSPGSPRRHSALSGITAPPQSSASSSAWPMLNSTEPVNHRRPIRDPDPASPRSFSSSSQAPWSFSWSSSSASVADRHSNSRRCDERSMRMSPNTVSDSHALTSPEARSMRRAARISSGHLMTMSQRSSPS